MPKRHILVGSLSTTNAASNLTEPEGTESIWSQ